jgi:tetratricopeptide (TPR) repeat protein
MAGRRRRGPGTAVRENLPVTNPIFAAADGLSAKAKRHSARGEHEEAIRLQREAVETYREIYNQRIHDPVDSEIDERERNEVAHRLADHEGRLGGVYRRAGQLGPALDSYTRGTELEIEWQLDDTYNRTNKIILALLLDPGNLSALVAEIEQTADLVRSQVDRTRRDQWWAWADMGLLSLLAGRPRDAMWAYDHLPIPVRGAGTTNRRYPFCANSRPRCLPRHPSAARNSPRPSTT